jgi:hypothetical protein
VFPGLFLGTSDREHGNEVLRRIRSRDMLTPMQSGILGFLPLLLLIGAVVIWAIPYWVICSRTGLSKWMLLALMVPILGWFLPWFIAFSKWPKIDPTRD